MPTSSSLHAPPPVPSTSTVPGVSTVAGGPTHGADQAGHLDLDRVRTLLCELGAVEAVEQRIGALTSSALDTLDAAEVAEPAATTLAVLAVAATRRCR
ncbi:MAG: hypothetical protein ACRDRH_15095 [Pseudonocardia sp.]